MGYARALCLLAAAWLLPSLAPAADAENAVLLEWNEVMTDAVADLPPPEQNRVAAIVQLAVFEAVNAIGGDYEPYLGTLGSVPHASARAAITAAAHGVLASRFPERRGELDAARERSLAALPDGAGTSAGVALGESAAAAMLAARRNDGSETPRFHLPSSSRPGEWQLTADCPPEGGVFVHFAEVIPFGIRRPDQFRPDPPPALASLRYAQDYRELQAMGGVNSTERSAAQAARVQLYAALSDAPLWNEIARQIAATSHASVAQNARALALLNMALSDAGVAVLEAKYRYRAWRPETAIHEGARDGNAATDPDPSFAPFIAAPCFPGYPSGHAATSYAAREILERLYGSERHDVTLSVPEVPGVTLRYRRLAQVTRDIDDARVHGGIHFRFDQEEAATQGRRLGAWVLEHHLEPAREDECARAAANEARIPAAAQRRPSATTTRRPSSGRSSGR